MAPSFRVAAAWLALEHPEFQVGIIEREPLLLLTHGDPGALPTETKANLLLHLARRHADGDIADDSVDRRSMWMFATPELSDAVRAAWEINTRSDFRIDLVRLIREGKIIGCIDLAAAMAADQKARDYSRIAGTEALVACGATTEIKALKKNLLRKKARPTPRFAAGLARALFPSQLSVSQLVALIEKAEASDDHTLDGFAYAIEGLWRACPTVDREAFIDGLGTLCARPPYLDAYRRVAKSHATLARYLGRIAHDAVTALGARVPTTGLITLLSVVERADRGIRANDLQPPLNELVRSSAQVHRALFWYDVAEVRAHQEDKGRRLTDYWSVFFGGSPLWGFGERDLPWLMQDLVSQPLEDDRRVAFSAIVKILGKGLKRKVAALRKAIKGDVALEADLARALEPPKPNPAMVRQARQHAAHERRLKKQEAKDKASWMNFRENLRADPVRIADPASVNRLLNLTEWLGRKTGLDHAKAAVEWRLLEPAFGQAVAEAYRDGMKALWRATPPQPPTRQSGGQITVKWVTILSVAGLAIEAKEDPAFVATLTDDEASRAALHAELFVIIAATEPNSLNVLDDGLEILRGCEPIGRGAQHLDDAVRKRGHYHSPNRRRPS